MIPIFLTLLNIAAVNTYSTFILNFPDWNQNKNNHRRLFLEKLGLDQSLFLIEVEMDFKIQLFMPWKISSNANLQSYTFNIIPIWERKMSFMLQSGKIECGKHSKKSNICVHKAIEARTI